MEQRPTTTNREPPMETALDRAEGKNRLHMQVLGLTFTHLLLLAAWIWVSQQGAPSARGLLALLALTGMNWLWLAVAAKRWWSYWSAHRGEVGTSE